VAASAPALELARQFAPHFPRPPAAVAEDLDRLVAMLTRWNATHNLVSRETLGAVWSRHVADSLQLLPLIGAAARMADLGSGGGFPALPLAIAVKGSACRLTLVEPAAKKVAFLRYAIRTLELPATVFAGRAEMLAVTEPHGFALVTSRALAPLPMLAPLVAPLLAPGGRALLHKGAEHRAELQQFDSVWQADVVIHPSTTDQRGVLLEIANLRTRSGA
jgi:16S rRNA (guanine527-N7)-methyltransferase